MGVFVVAVSLTVGLGGRQRNGAVASPGAFLSSPVSPLPTPTLTAIKYHRHWLPIVRGGAYRRQWLPVIIARR